MKNYMSIEKVKRFKTPKLTRDWYIKWSSSAIILMAMVLRSTGQFPLADMILSLIGFFNIIGSLLSGYLSTKMSKKLF